jgi:EAL domain-containing protein (putative c-di-GMP-specific phosphodiesterase class I)
VEPERFIPLAEMTGLILPLGEMALRRACMQASRWAHELGLPLRLGVNLSPRQFQDGRLYDLVEGILGETGLPPHLLSLEITESEVMRDFDHAIELLGRLKTLGVHLAVDDFGTGYSSLSYLKHFPIDLLKIDRSFVADVPEHSDDVAIVAAIIAMARSLGLRTMAEGIENRKQENLLRCLGCDEFQGFLYSRPVPADTLVADAAQMDFPAGSGSCLAG